MDNSAQLVKQLKAQLVECQLRLVDAISIKQQTQPSDHEKLLLQIRQQMQFATDLKLENQYLQSQLQQCNPKVINDQLVMLQSSLKQESQENKTAKKQLVSQAQIIESQNKQLNLIQQQNKSLSQSVQSSALMSSQIEQNSLQKEVEKQYERIQQLITEKGALVEKNKILMQQSIDAKKQIATLQKMLKNQQK
ncbi:hypothetical protein SS50377_22608 [Spironucleus salmonicida]|uniref:Uncharacterized protein n=1 Tax=Spironucleus salmonicida TaxID=348837 RepID=V6LBS9_9EUKA|nr:hypothetical protein SS50377_22608 [Spironucleus salmonicida]|eukprot:EST41902.1 Hypothetical protein SS50377_18205 [Spironucleus salmonicida]